MSREEIIEYYDEHDIPYCTNCIARISNCVCDIEKYWVGTYSDCPCCMPDYIEED